jgi:MFS family permease
MPIRLRFEKLAGVFTRPALVSIFLLTNAFVWYSYAIILLQESIDALNLTFVPNMLVWSVHFTALIVSALMGVYLTKKLGGRTRFLGIWVLIGTIASLAPFALNTAEVWIAVTLGLVFGFSLGFGMPNCMGYFTSQTPIGNRGRIGGFIILLTGVLTVGLDLLGINGLTELTITLAAWRAIALVAVIFAKPAVEVKNKRAAPSYLTVLRNRPFILYFVPWIMFALLNYLTTPVQQNVLAPSTVNDLQLLGNVVLGAFALLGGIFMDSVGRKRLAIIGFVMLGLSYSILGFFNDTPVWYVHTVMNGVSWGILYVLFVVTIWGDLSDEAPSDKFYALGVSPFFISKFLQLTINSQIVATILVSAIFSFTALFLFLAVLPLIYAPETLPEKTLKDRELKNYIEKAKKEVAKVQQKEDGSKQCESNKDEDETVEFQVNQEDEEKARELAEKYY